MVFAKYQFEWIHILLILKSFGYVRNALNPNILAEKSILDTLFNNYDKRVRPGSGKAGNLSEHDPAIVTVNMYLRSISKIDDVSMEYSVQLTFREEWNDERLRFDSKGKINYINLPTMENIWQPDLFFANEKKGHFHDMLVRNLLLRVYPNGNILYSVRVSLLLSCPMSLEYYPLDQQRCYIEMISYAYTTRDIIFVWKEESPIQIIKNLHLPSFSLERTHTSYCTSRTNTGEYSCLRVELLLRREFSYYLLQLYIPSFMLVIVSWVSFWLDKESVPARVSLGVTTLLTMATQSSGINAKLPPVSYTKAIDIWIGSCLTFIFGALLEFALVNYVARKEALQQKMKASNTTTNTQNPTKPKTTESNSIGNNLVLANQNTSDHLHDKRLPLMTTSSFSIFPSNGHINANLNHSIMHDSLNSSTHGMLGSENGTTCKKRSVSSSMEALLSKYNYEERIAKKLAQSHDSIVKTCNVNNNNNNVTITDGVFGNDDVLNHEELCECGAPLTKQEKLWALRNERAQMGEKIDVNEVSFVASANNGNVTGRMDNHMENNVLLDESRLKYGKDVYGETVSTGHNSLTSFKKKQRGKGSKSPSVVLNGVQKQSPIMSQAYSISFTSSKPNTLSSEFKNSPPMSCCHTFLKKYKSRSKRIDVLSRIFFPLAFTGFNIVYWVAYML